MDLKKEILSARGKNWVRLMNEKINRICYEKKDDIDLMIKLINGDIYDQAQEEIKYELKTGKLDKMLIPIHE